MTVSHLAELRKQLERRHWVIISENRVLSEEPLHWIISRPNGDSILTIEFTPGGTGLHRHIPLECIDDSIACDVASHPEIAGLYFASKFQGKFQRDVVAFADAINAQDKSKSRP